MRRLTNLNYGLISTYQLNLALTFALLLSISLGASCDTEPPESYSRTLDQMGTPVSITVLHESATQAEAAIQAAFAEIDRIDALMSTYKDESEISRLNRDGRVETGPDMRLVVARALEFHHMSSGAFDITTKPLLELYERSYSTSGAPPSPAEISETLTHVDARQVRLEGHRITLPREVRITLDGLAKGYAIDRAIEVLKEQGITHALVNAGGDLRALGDKAGTPWRVALQNPRDPADYITEIDLADASVATSGDYRRYFDPAMKHHHILDPRTGASAEELISVTIRATTAMDADALSTSVFVLGPDRGMDLIESLAGTEALLITDDREILESSGW